MGVLTVRLANLGLPVVADATITVWMRLTAEGSAVVGDTTQTAETDGAGIATLALAATQPNEVYEVRIVIEGDVVFSGVFAMPDADAYLDDITTGHSGPAQEHDGPAGVENVGDGVSLFKGLSGNIAQLRSLAAGPNISVTSPDGKTVVIAGAGSPVKSVAGRIGDVTLEADDVGLGSVDNTSDADKPVSTAQAAADTATLEAAEDYTDSQLALVELRKGLYPLDAPVEQVNALGVGLLPTDTNWHAVGEWTQAGSIPPGATGGQQAAVAMSSKYPNGDGLQRPEKATLACQMTVLEWTAAPGDTVLSKGMMIVATSAAGATVGFVTMAFDLSAGVLHATYSVNGTGSGSVALTGTDATGKSVSAYVKANGDIGWTADGQDRGIVPGLTLAPTDRVHWALFADDNTGATVGVKVRTLLVASASGITEPVPADSVDSFGCGIRKPSGLQFFTESRNTTAPNDFVPAHDFAVAGPEANIDLVLSPKGSGALLLQVPDGATNGNKRGLYAIDLGRGYSSPNYVPGNYSISIGYGLRADGDQNVIIGYGVSGQGYPKCVAIGLSLTACEEGVSIGHGISQSGVRHNVLIGDSVNVNYNSQNSINIGYNSNHNGYQGINLGYGNIGAGYNGIQIGFGARAQGDASLAMLGGWAYGINSIAIGGGYITGRGAVSLGPGASFIESGSLGFGQGVTNFGSNGGCLGLLTCVAGRGTTVTAAPLVNDAAQSAGVPSFPYNGVVTFDALIQAAGKHTDGVTRNYKSWRVRAMVDFTVVGSPSLVSALDKTVIAASAGAAGWDIDSVIEGSGLYGLLLRGLGDADHTIHWAARVETISTGFPT